MKSTGMLVVLAMLAGCDGASGKGGGGGNGGHDGDGGNAGDGGSGGKDTSPPVPADLVHYVTGNDADKDVTPQGPGLILMGGGTDVDAAFTWWKPRIAGGDIVVLRTSGADGYNDYLQGLSGSDSVETMLVTTSVLANSDYVISRIEHAEGVFMAGGDQATYVDAWKGTGVASAIMKVWQRGGIVGGTSAGCAIMGEFLFAAREGTVYSNEALLDPYNMYMTMDRDVLTLSPMQGFITDTHFAQRDRMGRLVAFLGRILTDGWGSNAKGLGIDERTAVVVDAEGKGEVMGEGKVYLVRADQTPTQCESGKPLTFSGLAFYRLSSGDVIELPSGTTSGLAESIGAADGVTNPAHPY